MSSAGTSVDMGCNVGYTYNIYIYIHMYTYIYIYIHIYTHGIYGLIYKYNKCIYICGIYHLQSYMINNVVNVRIVQITRMWVKPCHKRRKMFDGLCETYQTMVILGMVYFVLTTLHGMNMGCIWDGMEIIRGI